MDAVTRESRRLLMLAGPGTGKTETLTERISYFIREKEVLPNQVLMFTYTNKAANNMSQRIRRKLALQSEIRGGTFHSVCYRLLREEVCSKGVLPAYKVVSEHHARRLRREAAERYLEDHQAEAVFLREKRLSASDLLEMYERKSKLNLQTRFLVGASDDILKHEAELTEIALAMTTVYGQLKGQYQVFDFNDLLFQFMRALEACEDIRQLIQFQYPHIYVDEYQDTNRVQVSILKLLATPESFLTAVGDDTQSIYSFQGSEVENIRNFASDFDGAEVVVLNENYRSSPPIVGYVNALNATCQGALTKTLVSRGPPCEVKPKRAIFITGQQEAEWVVHEIQRLANHEQIPFAEIAVLTRVGLVAGDIETQLQKADIRYTRDGGIKFVDLKHIQMFISFLELVENPHDWLAWEIILPAIPNIGEQLTRIITKDLQANQSNWTWTQPPVFSLGRGKRLASVLNFWREMLAASQVPRRSVKEYLEQVLPFFQNIYARYFHITPRMVKVASATQLPDRMEDHVQDIRDYIIELSSSYIGLVKDFISEIVSSQDQCDRQRGITLSTIHSAKGLEWTAVFIIGNTENVFPSSGFGLERNDPEEERRLYYVACSRARKYLYVTSAYNYRIGQHRIRGKVSRFADDPRTDELLQKAREPGKNPFFSVNPHRVQHYFLTLAE